MPALSHLSANLGTLVWGCLVGTTHTLPLQYINTQTHRPNRLSDEQITSCLVRLRSSSMNLTYSSTLLTFLQSPPTPPPKPSSYQPYFLLCVCVCCKKGLQHGGRTCCASHEPRQLRVGESFCLVNVKVLQVV